MAFMSTYFKKKNNLSSWGSNQFRKRKIDDVHHAVKRLKLILIESDQNKTKADAIDEIKKTSTTNFPSFQLKNITFMSKSLDACLCQCSEDGVSIFLEDAITEESSIILRYEDVEAASMEMKNTRLILRVEREKVEKLRKIFQLEAWHHNNFTDNDGQKSLRLNISEQETHEAVQEFYKHLSKNLSEVKILPTSVDQVEDNFCQEVPLNNSHAKEVNVITFYGKSNKPETEVQECVIQNVDDDIQVEETSTVSKEILDCVTRDSDDDEVKEEIWEPEKEVSILHEKATKKGTRMSKRLREGRLKRKCLECGMELKGDEVKQNRCSRCEARPKGSKVSIASLNIPLTGEPVRLFEYPPPPAVGRISFTSHDFACLQPEEFFNDVNIDFYLKFFHQEVMDPGDRARTHIFSSFFYSHLTSAKDSAESRHQRVRNWTRNVDLFSKDFIIIPINQKFHWFLAIICFPGLCKLESEVEKCDLAINTPKKKVKVASKNKASLGKSHALDLISGYGNSSSEEDEVKSDQGKSDNSLDVVKCPLILIFDSLAGGKPRWDITNVLRQYLQMEWNERKQCTNGEQMFNVKSMKGCVPRCPQQSNHYDCGPYLLLCVQHFFLCPIKNFNPPIKRLKNWFSEGEADNFREDLKKLVVLLAEKARSAKGQRDASLEPTDSLEIL